MEKKKETEKEKELWGVNIVSKQQVKLNDLENKVEKIFQTR